MTDPGTEPFLGKEKLLLLAEQLINGFVEDEGEDEHDKNGLELF